MESNLYTVDNNTVGLVPGVIRYVTKYFLYIICLLYTDDWHFKQLIFNWYKSNLNIHYQFAFKSSKIRFLMLFQPNCIIRTQIGLNVHLFMFVYLCGTYKQTKCRLHIYATRTGKHRWYDTWDIVLTHYLRLNCLKLLLRNSQIDGSEWKSRTRK